jgi:NAD(P)-dependent dehydrogenase (short-subunit alcohol dehydrogenase family)
MGLSDKIILITGAASGIGLATARAVLSEGVGGLIVTDRNAQGLQDAALQPALRITADLADPATPDRLLNAARLRFGRLDGLVNAAGLTTRASLTSGTPAIWDSLFDVNAKAAFFLMQAAARDMLARGASGSIVNILSMNAHCGAPDLAIYSATKGAMATLTRNTARAHMADHIRVNGINLGWAATPSEHHMQSVTLGRGPGWEAEEAAKSPLGRLLQADEVARLATFLLGTASDPMSGAVIDLDQKVAGAV